MPLKVISSLLGELEYTEEDVYHFGNGIPGFEDEKKFLLVNVQDSLFTILHSTSSNLYFFLVDPFTRVSGYTFTIPDHALKALEITKREDVMCYSIAVLREPLADSTVNLVAPVIINSSNHQGMQLVLENTSYSIRHPLGLVINDTPKQNVSMAENRVNSR